MVQNDNSMSLKLKPGDMREILRVYETEEATHIILERLRELGVRLGTKLKFLQQAPFRGPFLFQNSTTLLALRKEELACLRFKIL